MTTALAPIAKLSFTTTNGDPLVGGKLFTYAAGTTTKKATYTDSTGGTPNENPIILDARGEASVWLTQSDLYDFTLSPKTDTDPPTNSFWTQKNVSALSSISTTTAWSTITGTPSTIAGYGIADAAESGANSDITSLDGLTTPLAVNYGGTGVATLGTNYALLGNSTSAVQGVAPGASGNVLTSNGTTWSSVAPAVPPAPAGGQLLAITTYLSGTVHTLNANTNKFTVELIGGGSGGIQTGGGGGGGGALTRSGFIAKTGATVDYVVGSGGAHDASGTATSCLSGSYTAPGGILQAGGLPGLAPTGVSYRGGDGENRNGSGGFLLTGGPGAPLGGNVTNSVPGASGDNGTGSGGNTGSSTGGSGGSGRFTIWEYS